MASFDDGQSADYSERVTWTSDDLSTVGVDNREGFKGTIYGNDVGVATIKCEGPDTGIDTTRQITVTQEP